MSDLRFPASLRPIVSKGYSQTRGNNIWRTDVQGGLPRQGRDTYFEPVPISITLVVSNLGRQAFYSFLTQINGGADSFIMVNDTGYGLADHQVMITSTISDSTEDGKNWVISFTATAERTAIQEDNCLTENLPDLFGCYGDCLGYFLTEYGTAQTTFPRIWSNEGPAGYPPIDMQASVLDSRIEYTGPSVNYLNSSGLLVPSAVNEWPVVYVGGYAVGRVPPESSSSNLMSYSDRLDNAAWTKTRLTVAANAATSPYGDVSAEKLIPTNVSGTHILQQGVSPLGSTAYVLSAFVKAGEYSKALIQFGVFANQVASNPVRFDMGTGAIISASDYSRCGFVNLSNGWYRVWTKITTIPAPTMINPSVYPLDNTGSDTFTGDGVGGIYASGLQVEKGDISSSPILTVATAVSRTDASAKVRTNKATSIKITYSDASTTNVAAVQGYATIPQADSAWGSKYLTRIDFIM